MSCVLLTTLRRFTILTMGARVISSGSWCTKYNNNNYNINIAPNQLTLLSCALHTCNHNIKLYKKTKPTMILLKCSHCKTINKCIYIVRHYTLLQYFYSDYILEESFLVWFLIKCYVMITCYIMFTLC